MGPAESARDRVARLYDRHGASLYRYALMLLADAGEAEDAVHQVFCALVQPRALTRRLDNEAHYLRRALRNACYSMLVRRNAAMREDPGGLLEPAAPGDVDPEERITLEAGLRALAAEQREVVHLHVFEGRTFREIADLTDESINTVASRYRYALDTLRRVFGER